MRRRSLRLLPAVIGPLVMGPVLSLAVAGQAAATTSFLARPASSARSASAPAAASGTAGYVHWEPGSDPTTTYNSTGGQVFITQLGPGDTLVSFAGITGNGGDAQVSTPITNATCSVEFVVPIALQGKRATPRAARQHAFLVQCYDQAGTQTDEPFDLLVAHPPAKPAGVVDYGLVFTGANGSLNANPTFRPFQFNSSGKVNSVSHQRTGVYVVTMPGSGSRGNSRGTVKVSPVGPGAGNCQVGKWTATRTAQLITVLCFGPTGTPQNRQFTVAYARGNNLMGRGGLTDANGSISSGGSRSVSQPATQFDSRAGAKITAIHLDRGQYVVLFGGSSPTGQPNGGNGHIQVTTVGGHDHHCGYTMLPTRTPELDVVCADPAGTLADTAFTVQWVVS